MVGIKKKILFGGTTIDKDRIAPFYFEVKRNQMLDQPIEDNAMILDYDTSTGFNDVMFELHRRNYFTSVDVTNQGSLFIQIDDMPIIDFFQESSIVGSFLRLTLPLEGSGKIRITGDLSANTLPERPDLYLTLAVLSSETWDSAIIGVESFGAINGLDNVNFEWSFQLTYVPDEISPFFKSTQSMFYLCTSINDSNIALWDVSNIETMDYMFYEATLFNQNLTCWDVERIPTEPFDFSTESALVESFKPLWGRSITDLTGRTGESCSI